MRSLLKSDIISRRLVVVLDHLLSILPTKKTFKKSHKKAKGKPVPAAGSSAADAELDPDSEVLDSVCNSTVSLLLTPLLISCFPLMTHDIIVRASPSCVKCCNHHLRRRRTETTGGISKHRH